MIRCQFLIIESHQRNCNTLRCSEILTFCIHSGLLELENFLLYSRCSVYPHTFCKFALVYTNVENAHICSFIRIAKYSKPLKILIICGLIVRPYADTMPNLRARLVVSVFLRIPDALAQVHGKSQGRLHGRIPTRSYTLWDLSSCPPGFVFLVTRLIPRKHATSSSFFEVRDWFSWRYKSPKCLEIRIYEYMKQICVGRIPNSLVIGE